MNPLEQAFSIPEFVFMYERNQAIREFVATEPYNLHKFIKLLLDIRNLCL